MPPARRLLVTGASGLLGGNLLYLLPREWEILGITERTILQSPWSTRSFLSTNLLPGGGRDIEDIITDWKPEVIIHTLALTNVDRCETDRTAAAALHTILTKRIADVATQKKIHLVHISTDHLFDGTASTPYRETDLPHPVNYYAETKWQGEQVVQEFGGRSTIVRTNFFGYNIQEKQDLAGWMMGELNTGRTLKLFSDVFFSPLLVNILVEQIRWIIDERAEGLYHVAAHDACSKYEFGMQLAHAFRFGTGSIIPMSIDESHLTVTRPKNMSLDVSKFEGAIGESLPTIDENIAMYKEFFDRGYQTQLREILTPTKP